MAVFRARFLIYPKLPPYKSHTFVNVGSSVWPKDLSKCEDKDLNELGNSKYILKAFHSLSYTGGYINKIISSFKKEFGADTKVTVTDLKPSKGKIELITYPQAKKYTNITEMDSSDLISAIKNDRSTDGTNDL